MQKTICSVFFRPLKATRNFRPMDKASVSTTFEIPAAKPGKFETLVVKDMFDRTYIGGPPPGPGQPDKRWQTVPVYADGPDGIAEDLINEWARNVLGGESGGGPGVFICEGDVPTQAELDGATARQRQWAEHLVLLADESWLNGRKTDVGTIHRDAAIWLGRQDLEWVKPPEHIILVKCPLCTKPIDQSAIVCPHCSNVVDITRWQQYQDRMEQAKKAMAQTPPPPPSPGVPPPLNPTQAKRAA